MLQVVASIHDMDGMLQSKYKQNEVKRKDMDTLFDLLTKFHRWLALKFASDNTTL